MKHAPVLLSPALVFLLSACATSSVTTTTTTFYVPGHEARGTIAVRAAEDGLSQSLEFRAYKAKIEAYLKEVGYAIAAATEPPRYVALLSYGIDTGKTSQVSVPIYGQTSGGTTYSSGTVRGPGGTASVSGSTYSMPRYGMIGATSRQTTRYTRVVAIDVVELRGPGGAPEKRYEIRARSTGRCAALTEVFDEMLEGIFDDFPGENGRARTVEVSAEANC